MNLLWLVFEIWGIMEDMIRLVSLPLTPEVVFCTTVQKNIWFFRTPYIKKCLVFIYHSQNYKVWCKRTYINRLFRKNPTFEKNQLVYRFLFLNAHSLWNLWKRLLHFAFFDFFLFLNKIMFFIILHKYKEKYINLMNDEINLYINSKIQNS